MYILSQFRLPVYIQLIQCQANKMHAFTDFTRNETTRLIGGGLHGGSQHLWEGVSRHTIFVVSLINTHSNVKDLPKSQLQLTTFFRYFDRRRLAFVMVSICSA